MELRNLASLNATLWSGSLQIIPLQTPSVVATRKANPEHTTIPGLNPAFAQQYQITIHAIDKATGIVAGSHELFAGTVVLNDNDVDEVTTASPAGTTTSDNVSPVRTTSPPSPKNKLAPFKEPLEGFALYDETKDLVFLQLHSASTSNRETQSSSNQTAAGTKSELELILEPHGTTNRCLRGNLQQPMFPKQPVLLMEDDISSNYGREGKFKDGSYCGICSSYPTGRMGNACVIM